MFNDWRYETGYLYVTKYGFENHHLFVELSTQPNQVTYRIQSSSRLKQLIRNVNILCIKGGGRYLNTNAQMLLSQYLCD